MSRTTKNSSRKSTLPENSSSNDSKAAANTNAGVPMIKDFDTSELSREGKIILSLLTAKLDSIADRLEKRDEKLFKLEQENLDLKRKLSTLEDRLQHLDNYNRRENIVLSGREIQNLPSDLDLRSSVGDLLKRVLQVEIPHASLVKAHRIGVKPLNQNPDMRSVLVKFVNEVLETTY